MMILEPGKTGTFITWSNVCKTSEITAGFSSTEYLSQVFPDQNIGVVFQWFFSSAKQLCLKKDMIKTQWNWEVETVMWMALYFLLYDPWWKFRCRNASLYLSFSSADNKVKRPLQKELPALHTMSDGHFDFVSSFTNSYCAACVCLLSPNPMFVSRDLRQWTCNGIFLPLLIAVWQIIMFHHSGSFAKTYR